MIYFLVVFSAALYDPVTKDSKVLIGHPVTIFFYSYQNFLKFSNRGDFKDVFGRLVKNKTSAISMFSTLK
jgi:hypothetical protein